MKNSNKVILSQETTFDTSISGTIIHDKNPELIGIWTAWPELEYMDEFGHCNDNQKTKEPEVFVQSEGDELIDPENIHVHVREETMDSENVSYYPE